VDETLLLADGPQPLQQNIHLFLVDNLIHCTRTSRNAIPEQDIPQIVMPKV